MVSLLDYDQEIIVYFAFAYDSGSMFLDSQADGLL